MRFEPTDIIELIPLFFDMEKTAHGDWLKNKVFLDKERKEENYLGQLLDEANRSKLKDILYENFKRLYATKE